MIQFLLGWIYNKCVCLRISMKSESGLSTSGNTHKWSVNIFRYRTVNTVYFVIKNNRAVNDGKYFGYRNKKKNTINFL